MWRLRLSDRDIEMVQRITFARQDKKRRHRVRTKKYDVKRDDFGVAYLGFFGEVAVARMLCIEPDERVLVGGDGGTDLVFAGRRLQIKTTISPRTKDWLYVNDEQAFSPYCHYGILCNIDDYETTVTVRGIIDRQDFIQKSEVKNFGYGERLAVHSKQLLNMNALIAAAQEPHGVQVGEPC